MPERSRRAVKVKEKRGTNIWANHWKRWDAKPEAGARETALCSFGCTRKPSETVGQQSLRLKGF